MDGIFDYFEDNYDGRVLCNENRRAARFPINRWIAFLRLEEGVPRTNNAVEGWHQAFQSASQCMHPTIWKLVKALQREEALQRVRYVGVSAAQPQASKKYVALENGIRNIVRDRMNGQSLIIFAAWLTISRLANCCLFSVPDMHSSLRITKKCYMLCPRESV